MEVPPSPLVPSSRGNGRGGADASDHLELPFEVQVSEAAAYWSRHRGGALAAATAANAADPEDGRHWEPCQHASVVVLDGNPCIAIRELPCLVGQFRLFDAVQKCAGPSSPPIVTMYEKVISAPNVEMQALGKSIPRTLAVQLTVVLNAPGGTQCWATHCQVRFRKLGGVMERNTWNVLEPVALDASRGEDMSVLVREEDGLDL